MLAIFTIAATGAAHAQSCSFTVTNLDFGTVDLTTGSPINTTGTFSATCTGTPNDEVRACASFSAGTGGTGTNGDPRYMLNGADQLQYNIFKDSIHTDIWGSQFWAFGPNANQLAVMLDGTGSGNASATVYAQIYGSQTALPVGPYTSSFSGTDAFIAYAYKSVGNCTVIGSMNGVSAPFVVQATNTTSCAVSATTMNFGTVGALTSNIDTTNAIDVACTVATPYQIGLNGGNAAATDPTQRKMSLAAVEINYGIYRDAARTLGWGDTFANMVSGTGTGTTQSYTAYGRVPSQTTPAPGTYTDTIVVTVTY